MAASLSQIGARVFTNWDSYYKLGQNVSQIVAGITNYGNYCIAFLEEGSHFGPCYVTKLIGNFFSKQISDG